MYRLLIRCSACFWTSTVMPCSILPQPQNVSPGLWYLRHRRHCTRSSILETSRRSRLSCSSAWISESWCDTGWYSTVSVFVCAKLFIKSAISIDLCGVIGNCFVKLEIKKSFSGLLVFCLWYFWLTWCAQVNSFAKSRLLQKWQPCPVPSPACCRANFKPHCHEDEIPNLRFELAVDWNKHTIMIWAITVYTVPFSGHRVLRVFLRLNPPAHRPFSKIPL